MNDKKTDNLTTPEVADLLKGPRGTHVQVTVAREGADKPIAFDIVRDEIPRYSVEEAFWLKPGIAFMKITAFNENTSQEMEENLKRLGETNIKGLVLDLRENPGGLLNEGVAVAGHYLRKGEVVVSQRGRASAEKPYLARGSAYGQNYPIVVLVNRSRLRRPRSFRARCRIMTGLGFSARPPSAKAWFRRFIRWMTTPVWRSPPRITTHPAAV